MNLGGMVREGGGGGGCLSHCSVTDFKLTVWFHSIHTHPCLPQVIPPSHDHQSSATQQFARQLEESLSAIGKRGVGGHSDVGGKPMWLERVGRGERRFGGI